MSSMYLKVDRQDFTTSFVLLVQFKTGVLKY